MPSLMVEIDRCLRRTGLRESKFGRLSVRDPRLVHDLRHGRVPGPELIARVRATIAELEA
jgi:hypothetical protein